MSHPVPNNDQPSYGGYPPYGEYPPAYPQAPSAPLQQYPPQPHYGQPSAPPYQYGQPYPQQQQAYPPQQYPQQQYQPQYAPQPAPQVIIQNTTTAAAFSAGYGARKRQSVGVHLLLFFFTAGLGNILYAWYVIDWNRKRGL